MTDLISFDPGNIVVGIATIAVSYFIAKSGKVDAKKFADAAQKSADEAEKNRKIAQRAAIIPHFVKVKKLLGSLDEEKGIRVSELEDMKDSLLYLLTFNKFVFLQPIASPVDRLTSFYHTSPKDQIADAWCDKNSNIRKNLTEVGLRKIRDELEKLKSDDLEL